MHNHNKKILHITHDLEIGGLQKIVYFLCKYIDHKSYSPSILCLRNKGAFAPLFDDLGIDVHCIPSSYGVLKYFSFWPIYRFLQTHHFDIVHTHNTQPLLDGGLAAILAKVPTIIHTDHGRIFPDKMHYMLLEHLIAYGIDRYVGVSDYTTGLVKLYQKIPSRKLSTIYNGIEPIAKLTEKEKHKLKLNLDIEHSFPILGIGSRLVYEKGITYLLDAIPMLIQKFPQLKLLIAGDGPIANELKKQAHDLNINHYVTFLGPRLDILNIIQIFDIYVLPSVHEGLPLSLLEAMSVGIPIVATAVGGMPFVFNGSQAICAPIKPKSSESIATVITRFANNQKVRYRCSNDAQNVFLSKFTAEIMTQSYERLYAA